MTAVKMVSTLLVWVFLISFHKASAEDCAYDVVAVRNSTGYTVSWSSLGRQCGNGYWIRISKDGSEDYQFRPENSASSIFLRIPEQEEISVICSTCDWVNNVRQVTVTQPQSTTPRSVRTPRFSTPPSTTVSQEEKSGFSVILVGVFAGASVVVLVIIVILIVCIVKRRKSTAHKLINVNQDTCVNSSTANQTGYQPDEGPVYSQVNKSSKLPKDRETPMLPEDTNPSGDTYAVVQKPNKGNKSIEDNADVKDVYAEVKKPSGATKGKATDVYENVQIPTPGAAADIDKPLLDKTARKIDNQRQDGLEYIQVDFEEGNTYANQSENNVLILNEKCEYAEVEIS